MMQQKTLADVNAYVEEMVNGQKVVKVFCHEEKAREELNEKNKAWASSAASANGYANFVLPQQGWPTLTDSFGCFLRGIKLCSRATAAVCLRGSVSLFPLPVLPYPIRLL